MINEFETFEKATENAQSALGAMEDCRVPASPMNYTVWYAHCSGNYPALSKALSRRIEQREEFTPDSNQEIFDRFFGTDLELEKFQETGGHLQSTLAQVLELVGQAERDSSDYGSTLAGVQNSLNNHPDTADIGKVVQVMLSETQKMVEKSHDLEESLQESAKEVEDLRTDLEVVRKESLTDALTGVGNRKCFEARMSEEIESSIEQREPLSLLLCDIDFFKKFNDTYGHRVGDEVLKIVGRHLREGVKGRDTAVRYGGEEFALILPETNLKGAAALAETLRGKLATKQLKNRKTGQGFGCITLSIGASLYRPGEPASELIQRSDEALYLAKRNGRNRVETEDNLSQELSAAS